MTVVDASDRTASASWLLQRIPGRSAREIGEGIVALVTAGDLAVGTRLPTIRELARAADLSPGTVLAVWNQLRAAGLIETHRRGGTIVVDDGLGDGSESDRTTGARATGRGAAAPRTWATVDLHQCAPDISLQPGLRNALLESLADESLNVFGREYMTDPLRRAVAPTWPFAAEAWATAGGGTEALLLAVAAAAEPGSLVAVHEPASPGLLDTLRVLSLTPIGVASDDDGPTSASLRAAVDAGATAFVVQPGGEFALHGRTTPERAAELADVIADSPRRVWVVEDDAIGPLAAVESPSLGVALPGQVIRVRSYCKAYGIDVRTSVLGGSRDLVERTIALRSHGVGSNSRILQNALAHLVGSAAAAASVAEARDVYATRRESLRAALESRGLTVETGPRSLVLWVDVDDETDALVSLAAKGISVAPGSRVFIAAPERSVIRISPLQLPDDADAIAELADQVAKAARGGTREFFD
ncbi:aminotransferase class I/II-fold pyridoxal phosphate-dependent enzyme [Microbacterium allomyrinae]|uniref:Aminotransferase class I/II-fold pyridoxal phosphate-dependent enzyme n=1 Tax=Microbacterium allomyrinae TaxID=2830666 RepID=A0A9X1S401_9MICO|nr:aminotransferase class I/II-fold pyridoxal phosphate-dependent enzyme [Microbacterium allomyrinae]MCC2033719.1 aminotransferase class I/II-fold pyridoxal phosphate-dependent enzyme [Microbacterium allomyrinae]